MLKPALIALPLLLLTTDICFSQAPNEKAVGCLGCFSEPQSTLLFRGAYGDLYLGTSSGNFKVPELHGWAGRPYSPLPAISPSGDRIAGNLLFMLNADLVKCDPLKKGWCDPQPRPIFKTVMGIYSVRDKTWEQYGDFERVGSAAFSPDGNKVAFVAEKGCSVVRCDRELMILNLETGKMTPIPQAGSAVFYMDQLTWSPDGRFLAGNNQQSGKTISGHIVVIDIATGETKTIAEGTDPAWSPNGDWIAYTLTVRCMIIHPDGTGARSVLEKEQKWMKWTIDAPIVWSPDGTRLLLNQRKVGSTPTRVIMVDLVTGHAVVNSKNGEAVMGWVPAR